MRVASLLVLVALGAGAAMSAAAADTPPPPASKPPVQQASASTAKPSDLDRIICHSAEQTGTRLPAKKECHSKREWEEQANLTRQSLDQNATHQQGLDQR
jgi:hypothetical protein